MSVFTEIKNAIDAITDVTGRVYHAEALKNAAPPFVFWLQTGESFEQALDGYTDLGEGRYEIHVVARKLDTLESISNAVWKALVDMQGTTAGGYLYERMDINMISPVINEHEVNLYRKVYNLTVNYQVINAPVSGTNTTGGNSI